MLRDRDPSDTGGNPRASEAKAKAAAGVTKFIPFESSTGMWQAQVFALQVSIDGDVDSDLETDL